MEKYTIIVSKDTNNKITANLYDRDIISMHETIMITHLISVSTKVEYTATTSEISNDNTLYYYEDSRENFAEYFFRNMGARKCDNCGKWIAPQDIDTSVYEGNNVRYCSTCASTRPKELKVFPYHRCPYQLRLLKQDNEDMTMDNAKALGIELEICSSNSSNIIRSEKIKCTDNFYRENKDSKRVWKMETDSSLVNGVEFISMPMSFAYAKAYDWNNITSQMKYLNCDDSHKKSGFHVHISKLCLGDNEKDQALNTLKLMYFMSIYQDDFFRISGRESKDSNYGGAMYYCRFLSESDVHSYKSSLLRRNYDFFDTFSDDHAYCIIPSDKTIEIRIFKSTSDAEKIKHTLALVMGLVEQIDKVPFDKIYCFKRMFKQVPQETLDYWRSKGAFLKTYATIKKGESL